MSHDQDEEIYPELKEMFKGLDFTDAKKLGEFCRACNTQAWKEMGKPEFEYIAFLHSIPTYEQYLDGGDYVGAVTKFAFRLYAALIGSGDTVEQYAVLSDKDNSLNQIIKSSPTFENERPEWIAGALAVTVAKTLLHLSYCKGEGHDLSSPYAIFNELRDPVLDHIFNVSEKYSEVASNIGMLIMSTSITKGPGFLEKNPVTTYYLDFLLRTFDDMPMPATTYGTQVMEALMSIKAKREKEYGLFVAELLSITMMSIQLGLVDIDTAKVLTQTVGNFMTALEEAA